MLTSLFLAPLQADLFGAGTDTTVTSILWALLIIAGQRDSDLQGRIQAELQDAVRRPSPDRKMSLLRAALLEVSRLRPVTPLGVPHGTLSDLAVGEYLLPPGTMLLPLHWWLNRDPGVWGAHPEEFDEARFLRAAGAAAKLLPFQTGRRRCIGADLGGRLVEDVVAAILGEFEVEVEEGVDPWHPPHHGFTLTPQPFKLRFTRRGKFS